MIVVLVIGVLLGIAIPQFLSSRSKSQARSCVSNLRQINQAKEQFAMANSLGEGVLLNAGDLQPNYIRGNFPTCPGGGVYYVGEVGRVPTCSLVAGEPPHRLETGLQP
jgi:type II secretory pathway pseudopilin PulG